MSYRNNMMNSPPAPCYYVCHLFSQTATTSNSGNYTWRINIPNVASNKQYFIRITKCFIQEVEPSDPELRVCVIRSFTTTLQNSFSSGLTASDNSGYSNVLGVFEIQHQGVGGNNVYYVAYNEEPHSNFLSGGFVNGSALQNNEFHLRITDMNNGPIQFGGTTYSRFMIELSFYEVINPKYSVSMDYDYDKIKYDNTTKTQVQGTAATSSTR